ncbi:MAG: TetR/AcrR family transcriptional regulator [Thermodesulfobacteriota bacterium]
MDAPLAPPRATFVNLPRDRQESLLRAAVAEFAEQGFQRASVNNIVRTLGIAKGSLYQYFDNKEALFLHVFDHFSDTVKQQVRQAVSAADPNLFQAIRAVLLAGIEFIDRHPDYFRLYLRVLTESGTPRREELLARVHLFSRDYFSPLCEAARVAGLLHPEVPIATAVFLIDAAVERFLQTYAQPLLDSGLGLAAMDPGGLAREIDIIIRVLRHGLCPRSQGE